MPDLLCVIYAFLSIASFQLSSPLQSERNWRIINSYTLAFLPFFVFVISFCLFSISLPLSVPLFIYLSLARSLLIYNFSASHKILYTHARKLSFFLDQLDFWRCFVGVAASACGLMLPLNIVPVIRWLVLDFFFFASSVCSLSLPLHAHVCNVMHIMCIEEAFFDRLRSVHPKFRVRISLQCN